MEVDLFFVLSGFLITRILLNSKDAEGYFRVFYARRALRIFPVYYLYLLLINIVLSLTHHGGTDYWRIWRGMDLASIWLYFVNIRTPYTGFQLPLASHFWSLAVEEQFYMVWPFIVYFMKRRHLAVLCVFGIFVSFLCRIYSDFGSGSVPNAIMFGERRLDGLFCGALVALAFGVPHVWAKLVRVAPITLLGGVGIFAALGVIKGNIEGDGLTGVYGVTPIVVAFTSLLVMVLQGGKLAKVLDTSVLRKVGIYSYGVYLFHFLINTWVEAGFNRFVSQWHVAMSPVATIVDVVLTFLFTLLVAAISFHAFEFQIQKLKPNFPKSNAKSLPMPEITSRGEPESDARCS